MNISHSGAGKGRHSRHSGKNTSNSLGQPTGASQHYASNAESINNMLQERYNGMSFKPQESSSVMIYEGLQNMK